MNADDRATTPAGGPFARPVTDPGGASTSRPATPFASGAQATAGGPAASTPGSSAAFSTTQATGRPAQSTPTPSTPASSTPTPSGQVPQRTSIRQGLSGQQPTTQTPSAFTPARTPQPSGTQPVTSVRPQGSKEDEEAPAGFKGLALKAKAALVTDDDDSTKKKGGPRRVRVLVSRVDPWSAMKIGFLLSIAAGVMLCVAVFVVWNVLNQMGLFATVNDWILKLFTEDQELDLLQFFDKNKVMSATVLVSVVNVVLLTALTTIAAFLYNTISSIVGGVYVTLTDD